jgi:5'-nucleotidase
MKFKRITAVIITAMMFIMSFGINIFADDESNDIIIYHTNDVHGYFQGSDSTIGHDVIAGIVETTKEADDATFLVSAGDMIQGTYFANNNRGEAAMEIMDATGYDVMTLGNHEFDYGIDRLLELRNIADKPEFMTQAGFGGIHWAAPQVFETDDYTVGFFGITTPDTVQSSNGGRDVDFGSFENIITYANDTAAELKADGVDVVICVTHMGIYDEGFGDIYKLRDGTEGIDLFIDGHSHTPLADITEEEGKPLIVSTGQYAENLGKVTFTPDGNGGFTVDAYCITPAMVSEIPISEGGKAKEAEVKAVIDKWAAHADELGKTVLAQNDNAMTAVRGDLRTKETILGDFVSDAILAVTGADVAVMNGGSIRADIPAGDITVADIENVLPFVNFILMAEVDGKTFREMLEHSVADYPNETGGFLQVSGVSFTFDPSLAPGSRITSITVGGKPLSDDDVIKVAANDWISGGGDGYTMLATPFEKTLPLAHPEITSLTDAVIWYIGTDPAIPAGNDRIFMEMSESTIIPATGNTPLFVIGGVIIIAGVGMVLTRKKKK